MPDSSVKKKVSERLPDHQLRPGIPGNYAEKLKKDSLLTRDGLKHKNDKIDGYQQLDGISEEPRTEIVAPGKTTLVLVPHLLKLLNDPVQIAKWHPTPPPCHSRT